MVVEAPISISTVLSSVANTHHFNADPDPTFHLRIRIQHFTLMRIRILFLSVKLNLAHFPCSQ
jgi:hypothetical protein